jgi:hypothetical protein
MGAGGSKEVVVPVAAGGVIAPGASQQQAANIAAYEAAKIAAETAYKEACVAMQYPRHSLVTFAF